VLPYVAQNNLSDWQFLSQIAREVGFVLGISNGSLTFKQPPKASDGPPTSDLSSSTDPLSLVMGAHILRIRSTVSAASQTGQVEVRGWDPSQKQAVTNTTGAATTTSAIPIKGSDLASTFGAPNLVATDVAYNTSADATTASTAISDYLAGASAEVEGLARGNSKLMAGTPISISLVGDPFDGQYVLTSARHRYDPHDGYTTAFTVSGRNQRSLLGLASGAVTTPNQSAGSHRVLGVVTALVSDVNDPLQQARVKLTFPWLGGDATDWCRVIQPGAGNNRGAIFLPEVNDEVVVAFDHGDTRRPYVIGSIHNGVDKPPLGDDLIDGSSGAVKRRGIISKNSHSLIFFDDDSKNGLALMTGDKNLKISLNAGSTTVKISSSGQIQITSDQDMSIQSQGNLNVQASQTLSLKGASVSIQADADVSVSGTPIKLN
jgi:uncharacterized protein involved in type VI secretion and phage assembly